MKSPFRILTFIVFFFLINSIAFAQTGTIRGTVIDDANGEPMFGVTVIIKGTTTGAVTDFDGKFDFKAESGKYDLLLNFVSYQQLIIEGIEVKSGAVNLIDNIRMIEDNEMLEEVVVKAEVIRNSEEAILTMKRKSAAVLDGISSASFRKIGDSDAASAIKRVTGVSVQGGKYVYVRGLGDRYTKTMLNNMDIPGLDPDRNTLQMDIFPTSLIDNMIISKSFVADIPADFTGGMVNIETQDFPEKKLLNISFGLGFTPGMHFENDYVTYDGSGTDFLGFDDGLREIPGKDVPQPFQASNEEVKAFTNNFSSQLAAQQQQSFLNYDFGISFADQIDIGKKDSTSLSSNNKLGYFISTVYKSDVKFYDDMYYGDFIRFPAADSFNLRYSTVIEGVVGQQSTLLGGMTGLAFKNNYSKYRLVLMHLQNAESRAARLNIDNNGAADGQSGYRGFSDNLEYNQKGLTNLLLNGTHYNRNGTFEIDWRLSPTLSVLQDPDIRKAGFSVNENGDFLVNPGEIGAPRRIWRSLDEVNLVGRIDFTKSTLAFGNESKIKFGVSNAYKERNYEIIEFNMQYLGYDGSSVAFWNSMEGNSDNFMADENLFPNDESRGGYYQTTFREPNPNEFKSNSNNMAGYFSVELSPLTRFKTILGLRGEYFVQRHTGRDSNFDPRAPGQGNSLDNEKVLDAFDLFPSVNAIYSLAENQNLRASFSRTIARPSFKELSFAQILDPVSNRTFNGGLFARQLADGSDNWDGNLSETRINNYDLRWELFLKKGQIISFGGFYKQFDDIIEIIRIPAQISGADFQPRNVGDAQVFGVEMDFRKSLGFISPFMEKIVISSNFTYTESSVKMTDIEFTARKRFEREGETIDNTRPMAGQSPYIINSGLSYVDDKSNFDIGLFYNVQGPTLFMVGTGLFPDVYAVPFNSLNLSANKSFGPEGRTTVDFRISNILNDVREQVYRSYQPGDEVVEEYFTRFSPRTTFNAGVKYNFF